MTEKPRRGVGCEACGPIREAFQGASGGPYRLRIDMDRVHVEKLRLCDELEAITDGLPGRVDRLQCLRMAGTLVPLLREGHRYEETLVFPTFARRPGGADIVARLAWEHVEDAAAAEDLTEILMSQGQDDPIWNPEAFGWMLRALFGSLRRHVAFERHCLMLAP